MPGLCDGRLNAMVGDLQQESLMKNCLLALLFVGSASAADAPSATIDCGTLSGIGVVEVQVGSNVYVVHVRCGTRT